MPPPLRFDPKRDAAADLQEALAQATAQGKRVLEAGQDYDEQKMLAFLRCCAQP